MSKSDTLRYGPPGENAVHLCVDMQRMFAEATEWKMPWLPRVLPNIVAITSARAERTVFTRFIPARGPGQGVGMWRHYYKRWGSMTIDRIGPDMIGLVPDLTKFVPPAKMFDKHVYSPWTRSALHIQLRDAGVDTLVITGGETDVCVLATMLGAIDWGFRIILVTDALCSSADETHDAMMNIYLNRFGEQVETVTTDTLLEGWPGSVRPSHLVQILLRMKPAGTGQHRVIEVRRPGRRIPRTRTVRTKAKKASLAARKNRSVAS